jgi:hypothetical protein
LTLSDIDTEEFRESLKQFQVALQDRDHVLLDGLGGGQSDRSGTTETIVAPSRGEAAMT